MRNDVTNHATADNAILKNRKRRWLTFLMESALHSGGGRTDDLLITDCEEFESNAASEVHFERFGSGGVEVDICRGHFVCP